MTGEAGGALLLQASSLSVLRGERVLCRGLTLAVRRGDIVQVEGENGAGKTSLLRVLAGLSRYGFEGDVERHAPLLYLGHHSAVKALLTPRENLAWHVDGSASRDSVVIDAALSAVGLIGLEDVPAHQLSAGQQRRINLARLFLTDLPLWLLDEPFTAIDRAGVSALEARFRAHARAGGAVVLTSHQPLAIDHPVQRVGLRTAEDLA